MKEEYDFSLPPLSIWDTSVDAICMDIGANTHYDLDDMQALYALRRLKFRYQRRMDYIQYHIARLEELNELTEYKTKDINDSLARAERWRLEVFPRELEIALHENGIEEK